MKANPLSKGKKQTERNSIRISFFRNQIDFHNISAKDRRLLKHDWELARESYLDWL